ncbi:hypothetical protein J6590_036723 [Homalodisca vitripennis]|nr:hypothetical protein J6590_036723 [Homalodisca vitripennis]
MHPSVYLSELSKIYSYPADTNGVESSKINLISYQPPASTNGNELYSLESSHKPRLDTQDTASGDGSSNIMRGYTHTEENLVMVSSPATPTCCPRKCDQRRRLVKSALCRRAFVRPARKVRRTFQLVRFILVAVGSSSRGYCDSEWARINMGRACVLVSSIRPTLDILPTLAVQRSVVHRSSILYSGSSELACVLESSIRPTLDILPTLAVQRSVVHRSFILYSGSSELMRAGIIDPPHTKHPAYTRCTAQRYTPLIYTTSCLHSLYSAALYTADLYCLVAVVSCSSRGYCDSEWARINMVRACVLLSSIRPTLDILPTLAVQRSVVHC